MKKVVFFNHKGGVSKTTSAFNIGWMIAEMGHKVLLVDADPQCNLSALFLGNKFDEYYEDEKTSKQNLMDGVRCAFEGKSTPICPIDCPTAKQNKNLYLIPGHMNLSEYDAQLNFAFTASLTIQSLKSLPGAFNDFIEKTANKIGAKFVFIDLNPGLSTINQDLFLISDAFVIPTNPDTFSLMAIKSLSTILPRWVDWKTQNIYLFQDSAYPLPVGTPKFIGQIPQRFNIRNGKATTPYRIKIQELADVTKANFIPMISKVGMLFDDDCYDKAVINRNTYILEEVKDFQGLAPKSLGANVPVFKLTDEQLETVGAVLEGQRNNVKEFYSLYENISKKIISVLNG